MNKMEKDEICGEELPAPLQQNAALRVWAMQAPGRHLS